MRLKRLPETILLYTIGPPLVIILWLLYGVWQLINTIFPEPSEHHFK
jgi:hypothetical protein